jgi:hypothetical protein
MATGHTPVSKPIFDDLMDIIPLIKHCGKDVTKCACTDPSYNYPNKCQINPDLSNHSGRHHCTYGRPGNGDYENSIAPSTNDADKFKHTVSTTTGKKEFTPTDATTTYPKSIMFCGNPTHVGGAHPTGTKSTITIGENKDPGDSWDSDNINRTGGSNLGFDKN